MTSGQLTVIDRTSKRFADDFDVAPAAGHTPTPAEETYLATLQRVTYALAGDEETEASDNDPASAVVLARRKLRASAVAELRSEAEEVAKGTLSTDIAADNALVIKGKYVAARDRLSTSLFVVEERFEGPLATDLLIRVARDLPPPNDVPSPEKQALFVALSAANTVVKTGYLVALSGFWITDSRGVANLAMALSLFFSGSTLPLVLFPGWIGEVARATPWAATLQVPIDVWLGRNPGGVGSALGFQLVWILILVLAGQLATYFATRKVVIAGG